MLSVSTYSYDNYNKRLDLDVLTDINNNKILEGTRLFLFHLCGELKRAPFDRWSVFVGKSS